MTLCFLFFAGLILIGAVGFLIAGVLHKELSFILLGVGLLCVIILGYFLLIFFITSM